MKRTGTYIGTVEYNQDPFHWGRVQVRVDEIYGTKEETPSKLLPWAPVMQFGGGFFDGGSHWIPPVGAAVVVSFEKGDSELPYVLGTIAKKPTKRNTYGRSEESMGTWSPSEYDSDIPKEAKTVEEETTKVVFKTPKGAALVISEEDGNEFIRLIDRAGQMLEFVCQVSAADNAGNAAQRGTSTAPGGIGVSKVQLGKIRIVDLEGQHISVNMTEKKISLESKGTFERTVAGNESQDIGGAKAESVDGAKTETVGGGKTQEITGNRSATVSGQDSLEAGSRSDTVVGGDSLEAGSRSVSVSGAETKEVGAAWNVTVVGEVTLTAPSIKLGGVAAVQGVARLGDAVEVSGYPGTIVSASAIVKSL